MCFNFDAVRFTIIVCYMFVYCSGKVGFFMGVIDRMLIGREECIKKTSALSSFGNSLVLFI